jgi:hypothetical protein
MQLNGMLQGSKLLGHVDFPASEVLGPDASEDAIQDLIARHRLIFIKPVFRGGVGKKGKAGLIGKSTDLRTARTEKERLYFAERHRNVIGETTQSGQLSSFQASNDLTGIWFQLLAIPSKRNE